ncbi:hypothetical protein SAMN05216499_12791 [Actinacidiphila paucisporea]|uniref:Uncharacterized protein n=2 Tax=Actinacidiphila paucisporea TaxID=310782 RepID=A0A1M7PZG0_9ACTN|nr:hypothetical protein SAMN05216499_12791 [Actinacidiphila paucisporea]
MTVMRTVTGWWRTGPGRRRVWGKDFAKLAPHVRPEYVEALFGAPAFELLVDAQRLTGDGVSSELEWSDFTVTERVWPLAEDGYLVTWSSVSEVHAYSLTTTSHSFKPRIRVGSTWFSNGEFTNVRLGRTRLTDLSRALNHTSIHEVASWKGARRHDYYESYYFGNAGNYQTWSCGVSGAGYSAGEAGAMDSLGPDGSPSCGVTSSSNYPRSGSGSWPTSVRTRS